MPVLPLLPASPAGVPLIVTGSARSVLNVQSYGVLEERRRVLARIRRGHASTIDVNPDTAPLAAGVNVTVTNADDTSLTQINDAKSMITKRFVAATGGQIIYNASNGRSVIVNSNRENEIGNFGSVGFGVNAVPQPLSSGAHSTGPHRMYFNPNAGKILFRVARATAGAAIRFLVDGRYVDKVGYDVSANNYVSMSFDAGKAERSVAMDTQGIALLFSTRIDAGASWGDATLLDPVSVAVYGDSKTEAGTNDASYFQSASRIVADRTGITDMRVAGIASTGYVIRGSTGNFLTIGENIARTLGTRPLSMVWLRGGFNDTARIAELRTAVFEALRTVRALQPYALIVVFGIEAGDTGPSASVIAAENAKRDAVNQFADPFTIFIPISTDPDGPWEYGTGRVGNPKGDGNADFLIGPDASPTAVGHTNAAGERNIADRMEVAVRRAIKALTI